MQLNRIEIKNFRSIKDQKITLDRNFTIFVGVNESGKSNVLRATSLIDPNVGILKDDIRDSIYDEDPVTESYVRFVFNVDNDLLRELLQKLKDIVVEVFDNQPIMSDGKTQLSLESLIRKYRNQYLYVVNVIEDRRHVSVWQMDEKQFTTIEGWRIINPATNIPVIINGNEVTLTEGQIVNDHLLDPYSVKDNSVALSVQHLLSVINKSLREVGSTKIPKCIEWTYDESNLLPDRIDLKQFTSNPQMCVPLKNMFLLSGYSDVSKALNEAIDKKNGITNILKRVSELTTKHMMSVWPEWKGLKVSLKENGKNIDAGIEDTYNIYSVNRRSDGFKRFFTFLLMISAESKTNDLHDNIIIIDEPEIGLHPTGTKYLRDELCQIGKKNIVFVSTHSIFMVDKEITDRHIIVEKKNEVTQLKRVESSNVNDEEVVFRALGYSVYELLRKNNIIFEGWRDKSIFRKYCNDSNVKKSIDHQKLDSIGLLHAMGAKDIERIALTCENFDRDYIILSDADKPAKEKKRRFKGQGTWFTFDELIKNNKAVTTEDFILNDLINSCLLEVSNKYGLKEPIVLSQDVASKKIEFIKEKLTTVSDLTIEKDVFLNQVKELIAENVTPGHLSEDYLTVVSSIISKC